MVKSIHLRVVAWTLAGIVAWAGSAIPVLAQEVKILVPKADIPQGTKLDVKAMFQTVAFPRDLVPLNAVVRPERLQGKIVARTLTAGLPVTERDLISNVNIMRELEPGYRAMTIRIGQDDPMAKFVMPGSRLDLLTVKDPKDPNKPLGKIILQNIKVLAVNDVTDRPDNTATIPNVTSITLMLRPDQVELFFGALQRGPIGIVIRKPGDTEFVESP